MMLVGVGLSADSAAARDTVAVFAEEFARMGFDEPSLMGLFKNPHYAGAHRVLEELGEAHVRAIVREQVGLWGRIRTRVIDADKVIPPGSRSASENSFGRNTTESDLSDTGRNRRENNDRCS
jgi:hypothetical protein